MKTTIKPVPHAEKPRVTVYEWLVQDQKNNVVAGGYGATREDAANDLMIWRKTNAGPLSSIYWRALTQDNDNWNFVTERKAVEFARNCGGAFIGRATIAEMNEIMIRSGVLKKGQTCK